MIAKLIAQIDTYIDAQLNEVLHHPRFQQMESAWRGVAMLVEAARHDAQVKVKLLNCSQRDLCKDLLSASEFDQTHLFQKIYTAEFDQPGGEPYGLLIGDYYFSHKPNQLMQDPIDALQTMSHIAASSFAPFVTGAAPTLFGLDAFTDFPMPFKVDDNFQLKDYHRWKIMRHDEDCRFLGLVMPRILMRRPFRQEHCYQHSHYLWGNAVYAFAAVTINCFQDSGWFANMRGTSNEFGHAGTLKLVRDYYHTDTHQCMPKFSTEFYFTDAQEKILNDAGFIALRDNPRIERGIFYDCPSIQTPKRYNKESATANAKISSMLHYILCASRFIHTIKVIMRDKVGCFINAEACERFLYEWLNQYTTAASGSTRAKARYPLNEIAVKVKAIARSPGHYRCAVHIKPHYQLDNISTHLQLVTPLKLN